MLTPVDIQQKRFKAGLGFDKKDVSSFFDEVSKSYGELYKSNAELKEKVITLTDTVQHYKVKEEDLNKTLLRAEKNSQESVSNAVKTAKNIEMEATSRANEIIKEAKDEKEFLETEISDLRRKYAEYKAKYQRLLREHMTYLEESDFDKDAEEFARTHPKKEPEPKKEEAFSGDRDSGSGGLGSGKISLKNSQSNSSNVYGSTLGGDGIDPFFEDLF